MNAITTEIAECFTLVPNLQSPMLQYKYICGSFTSYNGSHDVPSI